MTTKNENQLAQNAAKVFVGRHPEYLVVPENSRAMLEELQRLVNEEDEDPFAVETYELAFTRCRDRLQLQAPPSVDNPEELEMEDIAKLSPRDLDRLPDRIHRKFLQWQFEQSKKKPELPEDVQLIKGIFERYGYALTDKNRQLVTQYLNEHGLDYSESNIYTALDALSDQADWSEEAKNLLSAEDFKRKYVIPEFKDRVAKMKKPERLCPPLVPYVSWINGGH